MEMPRLEMEQQSSRIALNIREHHFKLKQRKSQLEMSQETGKLNINKDVVEVKVDGYPHRYDLGYKNIEDRGKEIANQGQQAAQKATVTYSRQGDQLADITSSGNTIVKQAEKINQGEKLELGLKWKHGPNYEVIPHKLEMKYKPIPPKFESDMGSVEGKLDWGRVKVSIDQYFKTEISVTGGKLNRLV